MYMKRTERNNCLLRHVLATDCVSGRRSQRRRRKGGRCQGRQFERRRLCRQRTGFRGRRACARDPARTDLSG